MLPSAPPSTSARPTIVGVDVWNPDLPRTQQCVRDEDQHRNGHTDQHERAKGMVAVREHAERGPRVLRVNDVKEPGDDGKARIQRYVRFDPELRDTVQPRTPRQQAAAVQRAGSRLLNVPHGGGAGGTQGRVLLDPSRRRSCISSSARTFRRLRASTVTRHVAVLSVLKFHLRDDEQARQVRPHTARAADTDRHWPRYGRVLPAARR